MAPKPDPATGSSATTRSQKKRDPEETVSEPVVPPSEPGGEESWTDILRNIYQGQERLSAKIDSLEGHRSSITGQMEELTSRMSRVELSSQSDSRVRAPLFIVSTIRRCPREPVDEHPGHFAHVVLSHGVGERSSSRCSPDRRTPHIAGGAHRQDVV
ncbi:hypothetical protein CF319_g7054 [Tilletia indica]|nr:hypothetical protein CF319_g7054 [Tilletia indica]